MAHWAEIDKDNVVIRVTVGDNNDPDEGYQWLIDNLGGRWIKASYNAKAGKRLDPVTHLPTDEPGFRKNFPGPDWIYDEERDAFIPPKPICHPGMITLNEETCAWVCSSTEPHEA